MLLSLNKKFPVGTVVLAGFFLLVMLATYLLIKPPAPPAELEGVMKSQFIQLRDFELIDSNNAVFDRSKLLGKWNFVFFGYTFCPDICPTTLHTLDQLYAMIEDDQEMTAADIQITFVSVDPTRDTTSRLREYIEYFNPSFNAATGVEQNIEDFADQFGAGYIIEPETTNGNYNVIHTSAIFLIIPDGRLVANFSQPHYPATIFGQFRKIRQYFGQ